MMRIRVLVLIAHSLTTADCLTCASCTTRHTPLMLRSALGKATPSFSVALNTLGHGHDEIAYNVMSI